MTSYPPDPPPRNALRWAAAEFMWPGMMLVLVGIAITFWYGLTHRTWTGGFVFAVGGSVFNRVGDRSIKSWIEYRKARP